MTTGSKLALVTGGAGFIGSHLAEQLLEEGWHVRVLDNLSSGTIQNLRECKVDCEILVGDLKDFDVVLKAVDATDMVFHFAANPDVKLSTVSPRTHFEENVVATFNLIEALRLKDRGNLVFASSSAVYGEPEVKIVTENSLMKPVSVYGASKASCESLIMSYSDLYGMKSLALRYANIIGPRLRHGVIHDLIAKLRTNPNTLEILGDGKQKRSFLYVKDAIKVTMKVCEGMKGSFDAYNVGNESWISIKEVADTVVELMNLKNINYIFKPVRHGIGWKGDVKSIFLDITKLKRTGWKPTLSSKEAVRRTAEESLK